jgi:cellulose biosynthesis protein BcsQ
MEKVLLAVGFRQLEDYIQKSLKNEFLFVGVTTYRDGVIRQIGQTCPDIIVIRETLHGNENILDIVYEIRTKFHGVRIVFVARKREPGDALLSTLVSYGIYDILHGEKIPANEIIRLLRKANGYKDVQHLQPKPVLDERKNKVLFERPEVQTVEREIVKEIVREVYIDSNREGEKPVVKPDNAPLELKVVAEEIIQEVVDNHSFMKEETQEITDTTQIPTIPIEQAMKKNNDGFSTKPSDTQTEEHKEKSGLLQKWFGNKGGEGYLVSEQISNSGKQKIITFMGSKAGIGNTSLALNTAVKLSQNKKRVIYVEMNDRTPAVNYWFDLGRLEDGIDSALKGLEVNDFEKIKNAIICSSKLIANNSNLQNNYRKFPETLDFMFFSNRYLTRKSSDGEGVNLSLTKELYLYLLFQMEYDYIILDVSPDLENEATVNALMYSNKSVITVSQDVSSIGNAVYLLNEMNKNGFQISKKMQLVINRFEKADLDVKEIEEWVQVEQILTVPCFNKEFINANFVGLPIMLYSKNPQVKSAFQKIEKSII